MLQGPVSIAPAECDPASSSADGFGGRGMASINPWRIAAVCAGIVLLAFGTFELDTPTVKHAAPAEAELPVADTLKISRDESLRSLWMEGEQQRFENVLAAQTCDTLVVPVQSQHFGFDRATRSLMAAQLALALAADDKRCVVDPYIASNALGDGMRRFDAESVNRLAKSVGAKTVVWTYAGHDHQLKMEIFMRVETSMSAALTSYKESARKSWSGIDFSDARPPFVAWSQMLPDVVASLGLGEFKAKIAALPNPPFDLPDAPEQLATKPSLGRLDDARRYELLASLGPHPEFRPTEKLFEKAWLAASMAADSPESRRIQARALLHLSYRPYALAQIAGDDSAEGRLLRALLDGNLPEAKAAQKEVEAPAAKLMASLEVRDLSFAYGRQNEDKDTSDYVHEMQGRSKSWDALLGARNGELDDWHVDSNLPLKAVLDGLYPIDGFSIEDILRGATIVGDDAKMEELQLAAGRHVNKLLMQQAKRFCRRGFEISPQELDFLQLVSARAQANLEKEFGYQVWTQGLPDRALELMSAYEAEFAGNPHFSALKASAQAGMVIRRKTTREAEYKRSALTAARSAAYWEQAGTRYALYARNALVVDAAPPQNTFNFRRSYELEFPPKVGWARGDEALRYSAAFPSGIVPPPRPGAAGDKFFAEIKARFHGSRDAGKVLASLSDGKGAKPDASALRAQIEGDPGNWDLYSQLADVLMRDANYKEALAVAKSYPGFKEGSGVNSVGLSNHAVQVASALYWHGEMDAAKPLYQLAAGYQNGSDSSLLSEERIKIIDGDYLGAAEVARMRVSRYQSPYAYRDYIEFLFAHGYARDAWASFMRVADRFEIPEFWFAAMVGHRVDGASSGEVAEWLSRDEVSSVRIKSDIPALRFGLMFFLVDRAPFADLPGVLSKVEGVPLTHIAAERWNLMRQAPDGSHSTLIARGGLRPYQYDGKEGDPVPSHYVLFAPAYVALRQGDYEGAANGFARMADFYRIEGDSRFPDMDVALPYFAFAAAKSGDKFHLKSFMDQFPDKGKGFEYGLAQAFFSGLSGRSDEALHYLKMAFAAKPLNTGMNGITDYQYAEACIWLFEETRDTKYRDLALAWARSYQNMAPTMAWAYALEARYGDAKDKRHDRAVAMALHLDRNSFWLSGVPAADIARGRAWLKRNNPFSVKKSAPAKSMNEI